MFAIGNIVASSNRKESSNSRQQQQGKSKKKRLIPQQEIDHVDDEDEDAQQHQMMKQLGVPGRVFFMKPRKLKEVSDNLSFLVITYYFVVLHSKYYSLP